MRVDYLGLEGFVAVAELGSFSRAAQKLNLTQTALSHRVRKLEQDLGQQLLMRSARHVSLTQTGMSMLPQVRAQLEALAGLYGDVRQRGIDTRARLSFACLPTLSSFYLPDILRQFAQDCPTVRLQLLDLTAEQVRQCVHDGEAEFGITIAAASPWDMAVEYLCTEPYVLLVPATHPLARKDSATRDDLLSLPIVRIRTQSTNRRLIEDALGEYSKQIDWRFEVQFASTAMSMVAAGIGATVLPRLTMRQGLPGVVGLPFSDVDLSRDIVAVQRRGVPLSSAAARLSQMIRDRLLCVKP